MESCATDYAIHHSALKRRIEEFEAAGAESAAAATTRYLERGEALAAESRSVSAADYFADFMVAMDKNPSAVRGRKDLEGRRHRAAVTRSKAEFRRATVIEAISLDIIRMRTVGHSKSRIISLLRKRDPTLFQYRTAKGLKTYSDRHLRRLLTSIPIE